MIENVIFDLYGTLIDLHTDENNALFWDQFALYVSYAGQRVDGKTIETMYKEAVANRLSENRETSYPDIDLIPVFASLYESLKIVVEDSTVWETAKVFRMLSTDYIKLYPYAKDLLDWLKDQKIKIFLLSNAQRCFTLAEMDMLGITEYFDGIYLSSDYAVAKPDLKFINILVENESIQPAATVFIGNDFTTDVKTARDLNMRSIYLHTNCSPDLPVSRKASLVINPGNLSIALDYLKKEYYR